MEYIYFKFQFLQTLRELNKGVFINHETCEGEVGLLQVAQTCWGYSEIYGTT